MTEATIVPNPPTPEQVEQQKQAEMEEITSADRHPDWYFSGSRYFMKLARFMNLLEPGRTVVSMTKVMLWAATFQTIVVLSTSTDITTVVGALGLNIATMVKHEARRRSPGQGD